ncbi:MAG TPA: hypothetical protein VF808_08435 [Ktedonobacterales bacterium]
MSAMSGNPVALSLTTDRARYAPTEPVEVTLVNGSTASLYTSDHQTCCSIISLRLWTGNVWTPVGNCMMMTASRIIEIAPGATMRVTLTPGAGMLRALPWPAGTYRAILRYTLAPGGPGDALTLESAEFVVA